MGTFIQAILDCVAGREDSHPCCNFESRTGYATVSDEKEERLASDIVDILFASEKAGDDLRKKINGEVHLASWSESLAKRVLNGLIAAIESGKVMMGRMKEAYDKALEEATRFVKEHPILTGAIVTMIAIGILVLLAPEIVELLGFTARGPLARMSFCGIDTHPLKQ